MKIYFSGSITGGREDKELYGEIIALLRQYGSVLTEHVGDKQLGILGQVHLSPTEVYDKDVSLLKEADVIVAEVTVPSLGVGYEIGFAEAEKKKIVCLYREREGKQVSRMILGNRRNECYRYENTSELSAVFDKLFK